MNFVQQLMKAPERAAPPRPINRRKVKPKHAGSEGRYRLYLEGQERTVSEIAALMGYSYGGTYASMTRMLERGQIKHVRSIRQTATGRKPALYTWVKTWS